MTGKDTVIALNDENFSESIANGVTLVDFTATWCGPCKMMAPIFHEVAAELADKATFGALDIDSCQKVTADNQVTSVPTLVLFKDGKEIDRAVGVKDADALKEMVEKAI